MASEPSEVAVSPLPPRRSARAPVLSLAQPLVLGVAAIALPFVARNFVIFQVTLMCVYAVAIMGLNLLTGFNGQFSLGHSAFYALGAYTAAIMMEQAELHYLWTFPVAGLVCFAAGSARSGANPGSSTSSTRVTHAGPT